MPVYEASLLEGYDMREKLLSIGEKAIEDVEKLGADQVEVYTSFSKSFSIDVENNAVKSASRDTDGGCGIRTIIDNAVGFAYVTTLQSKDIAEAVERSVALARASVPDPDFVSLPAVSSKYPSVKGLFDPKMESISSEDSAELILAAVDAAREDLSDKKVAVEARINLAVSERGIVNSLGVSGSSKTSFGYLYISPTIKEPNEQTSSYEYRISRNVGDLDPEEVGAIAARNARGNLGARTIEGGDMPILLAPMAVSTVIGGGFSGAVNAEEVQYGRSYISDAIGEQIGSGILSIVDDALLSGGIGSRPFDAEGFPSSRTDVLEAGVLRSLLHNSYTANKDAVDNTGNASRASYAGLPSIATSNLVVEPGHQTQEDLISQIDRGILCRQTGDRPNMTTGDLSAMIMEGSYIEGGEVKHSLKNTLFGINMLDLLDRVKAVGNDTRVTVGAITPSILIESGKVTSG
ncbi:TldD/PmbA family protein [Candidatus Thorarchaeota archaeon]|nr:MAG: TldD/PmbA family protein [Candidatus Thorarchaeota archaeon]